MRRTIASIAIALTVAAGSMSIFAKPAEAHGSRVVPGIILGAVVGGILAHEIYRHKRRHYYHHNYYYGGYAPRYYYSHRPYRHRYYYRHW